MIICNIEDIPMDESICKTCGNFEPDDDGICIWATRFNPEVEKTDVHPIFKDLLKPFLPKEDK